MPVWTNPGQSTETPIGAPAARRSLNKLLGNGDHGMLRRRVRTEARGGAQSGDRRRVDHVALALFEQDRYERTDAVHHSPEVDPEDPAPLLLCHLPNWTADTDPGVVVHEMDSTEMLQRPIAQGLHGGARRRRRSPRPGHLRPRKSLHAPSLPGPAPRYRPTRAHALGGGAPGDRFADATGPTCDHGHLVAETLHVPSVDPAPPGSQARTDFTRPGTLECRGTWPCSWCFPLRVGATACLQLMDPGAGQGHCRRGR